MEHVHTLEKISSSQRKSWKGLDSLGSSNHTLVDASIFYAQEQVGMGQPLGASHSFVSRAHGFAPANRRVRLRTSESNESAIL